VGVYHCYEASFCYCVSSVFANCALSIFASVDWACCNVAGSFFCHCLWGALHAVRKRRIEYRNQFCSNSCCFSPFPLFFSFVFLCAFYYCVEICCEFSVENYWAVAEKPQLYTSTPICIVYLCFDSVIDGHLRFQTHACHSRSVFCERCRLDCGVSELDSSEIFQKS
jgi:hypothetical protein